MLCKTICHRWYFTYILYTVLWNNKVKLRVRRELSLLFRLLSLLQGNMWSYINWIQTSINIVPYNYCFLSPSVSTNYNCNIAMSFPLMKWWSTAHIFVYSQNFYNWIQSSLHLMFLGFCISLIQCSISIIPNL